MKFLIYVLICSALSCIGSFIGVCYERIPEKKSPFKGRSHCSGCGKSLGFLEMIPVFGYLFLRGRCKACKSPIPISVLLFELLTPAIGIIPLMAYGFTAQGFAFCIVATVLFEIALLDYKTMEISDAANLIIAVIGMVLMIIKGSYLTSLIGMVCISVPFSVLALLGVMGYGDAKLMTAIGILLGSKGVIFAAFVGIVIGCFAAIIMKLKNTHGWKSEIAFGPYLCIGSYLSMLIGTRCVELYLSVIQ